MKVKKTMATDSAKANSANAVSTPTETIQNCSGMTGAGGQMKTRAHTITAPANDFNAHGNNIRIVIDYGDEHVQITRTTKIHTPSTIRLAIPAGFSRFTVEAIAKLGITFTRK